MTAIRRQGETHDPRRVHGPASTRNQVRSITPRIDALPNGALRVSLPGTARGWATVATTRDELTRAIQAAFTEAQIASYSAWRGKAYDHDALSPVYQDDPDPLIASAGQQSAGVKRSRRSDVHDPADWIPLEDGAFRSPKGREFPAHTAMAKRVRAKRRELGLE